MVSSEGPIARVLELGECQLRRDESKWRDYPALGLTEAHIPELIELATYEGTAETSPRDEWEVKSWAQVHAWRALGQLKAAAAVQPLVDLLLRTNEEHGDEWIESEVPIALGMIGRAALLPLINLLLRESAGHFPRLCAADSLHCLAGRHPGLRLSVIHSLARQIERFETYEAELNAFVAVFLMDLDEEQSTRSVIVEGLRRESINRDIIEDLLGIVPGDDLWAPSSTPAREATRAVAPKMSKKPAKGGKKKKKPRVRKKAAPVDTPKIPRFTAERANLNLHRLSKGREFRDHSEFQAFLDSVTAEGLEKAMARYEYTDEDRAQNLAYEAMEEDDPEAALRLARQALELDPQCVDALVTKTQAGRGLATISSRKIGAISGD
jgi:hypothetical protein